MTGLRDLWAAGTITLGAWLSLREPILAERAATSGYDYVCVDLQHGLSDYAQASILLHAMARGSAVPIVRVPGNDHQIIGRLLDAGALGVIVPMIDTADDARLAVTACRYAPTGARSYGPLIARARYGLDYVESADTTIACIPMIETQTAVENIDDILSVPGVDAIYVGPVDLALSLGLTPSAQQGNQVVDDAIASVLKSCRRHGKVAGIHATPAAAAQRLADGYRMLTVSGDLAPAMQALQDNASAARAAVQSR